MAVPAFHCWHGHNETFVPMPNVLDAQLWSLHPKLLKKSRFGVGRSEIESERDNGSYRHLTRLIGYNFNRSFGFEKAFRKMGAAFAYNQPKTQSWDNFVGVFGVV